MREMLEVELLGEPVASSLARTLAKALDARVEIRAGRGSVQIETPGGGLAEVLSALEEWASVNGLVSLQVRLNGRPYILECHENLPGSAVAQLAAG